MNEIVPSASFSFVTKKSLKKKNEKYIYNINKVLYKPTTKYPKFRCEKNFNSNHATYQHQVRNQELLFEEYIGRSYHLKV
jgi:hypothetical protein